MNHGTMPTSVVGGQGDEVMVVEPTPTLPDAAIVQRPGGVITASGELLADRNYFFDVTSNEPLVDSFGHALNVTWNVTCPTLPDAGTITPWTGSGTPHAIRWLTPPNCRLDAKRGRCSIGATIDNGFGLSKTLSPLDLYVRPEGWSFDNDHDGFSRATEVYSLGTDPCVANEPREVLIHVARRVLRRTQSETFSQGGRRRVRSLLRSARVFLRRGGPANALPYLVMLREGLNGCPPQADTDALVVDCDVQLFLRPIIDELIAHLSAAGALVPWRSEAVGATGLEN